ncbi:hypothetical protein JHD46_08550 [Sulfurimonas sp. SAG-AH-194-C20]|nr:hypothetical protein [Sulfurimonas sp. SAG-AH-194-C20]MDF1879685.1 hypothetical protein [Sulfurimonas sp. SAG-AH-194-C20]
MLVVITSIAIAIAMHIYVGMEDKSVLLNEPVCPSVEENPSVCVTAFLQMGKINDRLRNELSVAEGNACTFTASREK